MYIMTERGWMPIAFPAKEPEMTYTEISERDIYEADRAGNHIKVELANVPGRGHVWVHRTHILHKPKVYRGEITLTPSTDVRILERQQFE